VYYSNLHNVNALQRLSHAQSRRTPFGRALLSLASGFSARSIQDTSTLDVQYSRITHNSRELPYGGEMMERSSKKVESISLDRILYSYFTEGF